LAGIGPRDEIEGMLAAQMIAVHNAAMECLRRAMLPNQSFEARQLNLNLANKLSRTYAGWGGIKFRDFANRAKSHLRSILTLAEEDFGVRAPSIPSGLSRGRPKLKKAILTPRAGWVASRGIIIAARLGSGSSNAGVGFELDVIAAVVLGGTSLFGGRGTMAGTLLGALTVAVIGNGLILAHVSPFLAPIVTGAIILIAIWLNFRLFRAGRPEH
jgi:hypothetical protein